LNAATSKFRSTSSLGINHSEAIALILAGGRWKTHRENKSGSTLTSLAAEQGTKHKGDTKQTRKEHNKDQQQNRTRRKTKNDEEEEGEEGEEKGQKEESGASAGEAQGTQADKTRRQTKPNNTKQDKLLA